MVKHAKAGDIRSNPDRYLCLLLYAPGHTGRPNEPVRGGGTWLQKMAYMISKYISGMGYQFGGYRYGAFSPELEGALRSAGDSGLITRQRGGGGGCDADQIRLSDRGMELAEALWKNTAQKERESITLAKEFLNKMDYWEMISYSYSEYPETTDSSEIEKEFQKRRLDAAASLFQKEIVSMRKAAFIAGKESEDFRDMLLERGIMLYELDAETYRESLNLIDRIIGR